MDTGRNAPLFEPLFGHVQASYVKLWEFIFETNGTCKFIFKEKALFEYLKIKTFRK